MADQTCANCPWRSKYDANPRSFSGRLWRWHINFCPGWKAYFATLQPEEQAGLAERYHLRAAR